MSPLKTSIHIYQEQNLKDLPSPGKIRASGSQEAGPAWSANALSGFLTNWSLVEGDDLPGWTEKVVSVKHCLLWSWKGTA